MYPSQQKVIYTGTGNGRPFIGRKKDSVETVSQRTHVRLGLTNTDI
jgi:hypothetical protein